MLITGISLFAAKLTYVVNTTFNLDIFLLSFFNNWSQT